MGLGDLFKASENTALKARIAELEAMLTPELRQLDAVKEKISEAESKLSQLSEQQLQAQKDLEEVLKQQKESKDELNRIKGEVIETEETVLLQSFGLYEPKYDFASSAQYKDRLDQIRKEQKRMIKGESAALGSRDWSVNGSASQGQKMVKDMQKLLIRAFNSECDELISKVKFNNIEASVKRMRSSKDAISRLGKIMDISISPAYFDRKLQELYLAHEYQVKKQEEKEEQKRIRAEEREQTKLQKEIEAERKKLEKEQTHCKNALAKLLQQDTSSMTEEECIAFNTKKSELEAQLGEIAKGMEDVDYRAANQRAGYVYVISNVGSFGEDIYKIGMTRRLDPMDRVDELGDASVPFNFDVHAMIFSGDAPALEAALHNAFEDRKLNMVNTRREFFHVTLDEIKEVVRQNFDKTVEFVDVAPAEQYRESLLMKKQQA